MSKKKARYTLGAIATAGLMVFTSLPCTSIATSYVSPRHYQAAGNYHDNLRTQAQSGNVKAQLTLARYYLDDRTPSTQNLWEAYRWLYKAAEKNNAHAQFLLSQLITNKGHWLESNYLIYRARTQQSRAWLLRSAHNGHAQAQYELGRKYHYGFDTPKNIDFAYQWYWRAAEQNNDAAQTALANIVMNGEKNVSQEQEEQILRWLIQTANGNNSRYHRRHLLLANFYNAENLSSYNPVRAMNWYAKAIEQHSAEAAYRMGMMYYSGHGVRQNYRQAFNLFIQAATFTDHSGHVYSPAAYQLFEMYAKGLGVTQSDERALHWLTECAQSHHYITPEVHSFCAQLLSQAHSEGSFGLKVDHLQALNALKQSARRGNAHSQYQLAEIYYQGQNVEQDKDYAFAMYLFAAQQGHAQAQYKVGRLYCSGELRFQDAESGEYWLGEAIKQNIEEAEAALQHCHQIKRLK